MDILRPEAEEFAVIGIAARGKASELKELRQLSSEDFSHSRARCIFEAVQSILLRGDAPVLAALDEELTRKHGKETADALMLEVTSAVSETALRAWELPRFVKIISEASQRRRLVKIGEALSRAASNEQRDMTEVLDAARTSLRGCTRSSGRVIPGTDVCLEAYDSLWKTEKPIPTGIRELDAILCGGLHRGELTILGARPAVGKSSLLLWIAVTAAKAGFKVFYISLEMSAAQLGARLLAVFSGVNTAAIRGGKTPNDSQAEALATGLSAAGQSGIENISLLAAGTLTVEELYQETLTQVDAGKCDLLLVDYLQLLRTRHKTGSDFERLGIVSRGLKSITLGMNIPVVAAAQVRRQNNGGVLRPPGLDELRGSGDIEQDGDNVLLLHRPEGPDDATLKAQSYQARHNGLFEGAQMRKMQLLTVEVAKQRQGMTARAWTIFDPAHSSYIDPCDT